MVQMDERSVLIGIGAGCVIGVALHRWVLPRMGLKARVPMRIPPGPRALTIDSLSRRVGEKPTTITYTPQWPYGRATVPAGGAWIREYGRSYPLPEAITQIREARGGF